MRSQFKILFSLLLFYSCNFSFAQGVWTQKADIPVTIPRYGAVGFSIGTKGYIGTMQDFGGGNYDFWEWDSQSNNWTSKSSFTNEMRRYSISFTINNKGYTGTGTKASSPYTLNDFWEYNPLSDAWTQKAGFPGTPRVSATGFAIDTLGYLGLGLDSGGLYTIDFWQYSPITNSWKSRANFPGCPRFRSLGLAIGNKGYVFFGEDTCSPGVFTSEVWEYNPTNDSWTQKANFLGMARSMSSGFALGDTGYVGIGYTGGVPLCAKDFWTYAPSSDTWVQIGDFGGGYRGYSAVGFSIGNKGYISTGDDGVQGYWDLWEFNPSPNAVEQQEMLDHVSLFPNPFHYSTTLRIDGANSIEDIRELEIINVYGIKVTNDFVFTKYVRENSIIVSLTKHNANIGVYFYKVNFKNKVSAGSFIIK